MDDSRKIDLEELMKLYKYAPNQAKREELERIITKIMRESGAVRERRQELIKAIRSGDRKHVRRVQEQIRIMDMNQYGGRETIRA